MATGTPTYPTTLDTNATVGPTSGITAGQTATSATGTNQGDLLGIINNLIAVAVALENKVGVNSSAVTTSLDYRVSNAPQHIGQATLDFGTTDNGGADIQTAVTTVTAAWIANPGTYISLTLMGGPNHAQTDDDDIVEEIVLYPRNLVAGVSFDIVAVAPNGSQGQWYVNYITN